MIERLPPNLEDGLLIIHRNEHTSIEVVAIKQLTLMKFISTKHGGGWMINGNGRAYIREFRLM